MIPLRQYTIKWACRRLTKGEQLNKIEHLYCIQSYHLGVLHNTLFLNGCYIQPRMTRQDDKRNKSAKHVLKPHVSAASSTECRLPQPLFKIAQWLLNSVSSATYASRPNSQPAILQYLSPLWQTRQKLATLRLTRLNLSISQLMQWDPRNYHCL